MTRRSPACTLARLVAVTGGRRRVLMTSKHQCSEDWGTWRYFWLDDHVAVKIRNDRPTAADTVEHADELWPTVGGPGQWFFYGPGTDDVLGSWHGFAGTGRAPVQTRYLYMKDHRNSVVNTKCEVLEGGSCAAATGSGGYKAGLDRNAVRAGVEQHLQSVASQLQPGKTLNQVIEVGGTKIQYSAHRLKDGVVNVGRIHPVP